MLDKLNQPSPAVSKEQFLAWRNDPITEHYFLEMEKFVLDCLIAPLPLDSTGISIAYRNDGKRELAEILLEWEPQGMGEADED